VIRPAITFFEDNLDYNTNMLGEKGAPVPEGFEYSSGKNPHFLTIDELHLMK